MTDPRPNRRIQIVAVGCAVAALATAVIAVVVVTTRPAPEAPPAPSRSNTIEDHRVNASDVVKLDKMGNNTLWSMAPDGIRIDDAELRKALGLERDDVITAMSGHPFKRDRDVHRAVFDLGLMSSTTIYVEAIRDHDSVLLRWRVDGDLREARRAADRSAGSASVYGGLVGSGTPSPSPWTPVPYLPSPIDPADQDPLVASVKVIDDDHIEVPQSTVDKVFADPAAVMKGARVVPAVKNGQPDGFKLYAIRPSSLFAALHFQNGDTIRSVNHEDLYGQTMDMFPRLKAAKQFEFDITRRGKGVTLTIDVK